MTLKNVLSLVSVEDKVRILFAAEDSFIEGEVDTINSFLKDEAMNAKVYTIEARDNVITIFADEE